MDERDVITKGDKVCNFYSENLAETAAYVEDYYQNKLKVVKGHDMPFENSPQGLLKHMVHEKMDTVENCVDIYMQFIPGGMASGKHRHLAEEVFFVAEGEGYDLHWDVNFSVDVDFSWSWEKEPKKFEWKRGDFVYVPPYVEHKHFNKSETETARIVVVHNRILKAMGAAWYEQLEPYDGYTPSEDPIALLEKYGVR
ncbi:MAG: cupin domain-containing protein [Proteobacteria bacterium]|nr:cupin domain-containing protein [Pseudomonadota bacterium]